MIPTVYEAVSHALNERLIGGYETFDAPNGIVILGPVVDEVREVFLLTISEAQVEVTAP